MITTQITCRGFSCSDSVKTQVSNQVEKLEKLYNRITRCEVTIDLRHRHQRQGKTFHVQVYLQVPHADIVISREPELDQSPDIFAVALQEAFHTARRRLEDHIRIQRGFVKTHFSTDDENLEAV